MEDEEIEVLPCPPQPRPPKPCRDCGADRPPNATYCPDCAATRRKTKNREHARIYRARKSAHQRELTQAGAADRREAFLKEHGF